MEVLERVAEKLADNFVRIAGQLANSYVIVVKLGPNPAADEQLEFSEFFKPWRFVKKILRVGVSFGCLEKNLRPTDGECEQYTHKYSTWRVAQHDHISSRKHAWLKSCKAQDCTSMRRKTSVIHVSCIIPCRTWHWPLAQVLSHLPLLSFRRSHGHSQDFWYTMNFFPATFNSRVMDQRKSPL